MSKWLTKIFGETKRVQADYAKCRRCRTRFKPIEKEVTHATIAGRSSPIEVEQYDRKTFCSFACAFPKPEAAARWGRVGSFHVPRPTRRHELRLAAMAEINKRYGPHKPTMRHEPRRTRRQVSREVARKWYKDEVLKVSTQATQER